MADPFDLNESLDVAIPVKDLMDDFSCSICFGTYTDCHITK